LARRSDQRNTAQNFPAWFVGKGYVAIFNQTEWIKGVQWRFGPLFDRRIHNLKHAFAGRPSTLEHLVEGMEPAHRFIQKSHQNQTCHQFAKTHFSFQHGLAAETGDDR
jgi:hypothetical protein